MRRRRVSLDRRVQLTLTPPGKRTRGPVVPTPEALAAGRVRRRIEDRDAARRLRDAVDWLGGGERVENI